MPPARDYVYMEKKGWEKLNEDGLVGLCEWDQPFVCSTNQEFHLQIVLVDSGGQILSEFDAKN